MLPSLKACCQVMLTKSLLVLNKIWFWAAVFWTVFVTVICLITFPELPEVSVDSADKYVHASIHFLFTVFWALHFRSKENWTLSRTLTAVFIMSVAFGISIEIAQNFLTDTRTADVRDIAANSAGALLGILSILFYDRTCGKSLIV